MKRWKRLLMGVFCAWFAVAVAHAQDLLEQAGPPPDQVITVNLAKKRLYLYEGDTLIFSFPVRIGKPTTPTPVSVGFVSEKRDRPVFRHTSGPDKGKIIRQAECANGVQRVPGRKMRSLGLKLRRSGREPYMVQYNIHSVTCSETINHAISLGCVGLKIPHMLKLFDRARVGAKVVILKR